MNILQDLKHQNLINPEQHIGWTLLEHVLNHGWCINKGEKGGYIGYHRKTNTYSYTRHTLIEVLVDICNMSPSS